jgi:hypothetical protein
VNSQAGVERAQPAQRQIGIERRPGQAEGIGPPAELLADRRIAGDRRPADDVAVAVDIFGGRMDDDVGAMLDRPLQHRREEGIVDHGKRANFPRRANHRSEVGDPQQRVGRRLDPHQRGLARQCLGQRGWIGLVANVELKRPLGGERVEQAPAAAVAVVRHEQPIAGPEQGVEDDRDRAHPGRGDDPARPTFERGKRLAEMVAGRVAAAAVIVTALAPEAVEGKICRERDRRHDCAMGRVGIDRGADGASG